MKEMKTQLILFSLLLLGSTAWAATALPESGRLPRKSGGLQPDIETTKLKTLASSEARKIAIPGFLPENRRKQTVP